MPVYVKGITISDDGNLVLDADEMADAGVRSVEFIERAAVIAAEEADRQTAELRAQLAEYKDALTTLGIKRDVLAYISGLKTGHQMEIEALEAQLAQANAQIETLNTHLADARTALDYTKADAEARAEAAKEWERDVRRADEELDKLGAPITGEKGGQLNTAGRIRYLFQKAEARAADLARLCQNLIDAHARARKAEDAVDRDPENGDLDEFEDAFACLIICENEARAALNPGARQEEAREWPVCQCGHYELSHSASGCGSGDCKCVGFNPQSALRQSEGE